MIDVRHEGLESFLTLWTGSKHGGRRSGIILASLPSCSSCFATCVLLGGLFLFAPFPDFRAICSTRVAVLHWLAWCLLTATARGTFGMFSLPLSFGPAGLSTWTLFFFGVWRSSWKTCSDHRGTSQTTFKSSLIAQSCLAVASALLRSAARVGSHCSNNRETSRLLFAARRVCF